MAIYRGEGGATDVEPAPGDTEFAGGIIVEGDILSKGKITAEEGFYGDGSNLTNVADAVTLAELGIPNHELITVTSTGATTIPKDLTVNGVTVGEGQGSGLLNTIVGDSAFTSATTGGSNTVLGSNAGKTITSGTGNIVVGSGAEPSSPSVFNEVTIGRPSISTTRLFGEVVAPSFKGDGSLLTGLPAPENVYTKEDVDFIVEGLDDEIALKVDEAPEDGKQYARQDKAWTEVEASGDTYTKAEIDAQQEAQDDVIDVNTGNISFNTMNIATNKASISTTNAIVASNTAQIATNTADIAGLSGAIVYKGNINVSATDAPAGAVTGDMYVNNYNEAEPDTSYPVTGWGSITSVTYADRVIKTDTDWDILPVSGGGGVPTDTYTKAQIDEQQGLQDVAILANTDAIAALPTPVNTYTKTEIDTQQNAQDVEIAKKANTDDTYTKTETDTLLDNKANVGDSYTKAETYNNTEIDSKLFEKANKSDVDDSQDAQDVNISSNTTAIGTLSGQVSQNSEDISELQDSIFFSSAYSADYPSAPNRDPENGNMYLQNVALFTYSYAEATQIFASKTDESGNVRQFTAIKPGDSIVLNEIESPNYGRYELVSVEDVSGSYVVMNVIPKLGQGTVITGVKVAFQAFPKPGSDSIWTEEDGVAVYGGDIKVNDVTVGRGSGDAPSNVVVGPSALNANVIGTDNVAIGQGSLNLSTGTANTGVGENSLAVTTGNYNTSIGRKAGDSLTTGGNNTLLGHDAQPSAPDVSNEVTIGNDGVTTVRMGNGDIVYPASGGGTLDIDALPALPTELEGTDLFVTERTGTNYKVTADELSLGGGSTWTETVIYDNPTGTTTAFALDETYTGYDYVRWDTKRTDYVGSRSDMFPSYLCDSITLDNYSNFFIYAKTTDGINFTIPNGNNVAITKVVGINIGE